MWRRDVLRGGGRGPDDVRAAPAAAGLQLVHVPTEGFKLPFSDGMENRAAEVYGARGAKALCLSKQTNERKKNGSSLLSTLV